MSPEYTDKARKRIREAVIGAVVALIFSPIGIIAGFFLNDYLARDKLRIVGIELFPVKKPLSFSLDHIREISASQLYRDYDGERYTPYQSELSQVFEREQSLRPDQVKPFLHQLDRLLAYTEQTFVVLTAAIQYLEKNDFKLAPPQQAAKHRSIGPMLSLFAAGRGKPDDRLSAIAMLRQSDGDLLRSRKKVFYVRTQAEVYRPERTGQLRIRVVVVNEGNTDGLISGKGELLMVDEDQTLDLSAFRITEGESGGMALTLETVPRRSIATFELWVDVDRSRAAAVKALTRALKNNDGARVRVRLTDVRKRFFESDIKKLPMPVDR